MCVPPRCAMNSVLEWISIVFLDLSFFFSLFFLNQGSIWFSLTVSPGDLHFLCSFALNHSTLHLYGTRRIPKHAEIISQISLLEAWAQLIPKLMGGEHRHLKGRVGPSRQRTPFTHSRTQLPAGRAQPSPAGLQWLPMLRDSSGLAPPADGLQASMGTVSSNATLWFLRW